MLDGVDHVLKVFISHWYFLFGECLLSVHGLELSMQTRLSSNSQKSYCICLWGTLIALTSVLVFHFRGLS